MFSMVLRGSYTGRRERLFTPGLAPSDFGLAVHLGTGVGGVRRFVLYWL